MKKRLVPPFVQPAAPMSFWISSCSCVSDRQTGSAIAPPIPSLQPLAGYALVST